jgi:hypothetical protein
MALFDFSDVTFERLIVHAVGNKKEDGTIFLSKQDVSLSDETVKDVLLSFFLRPFKTEEFYSFDTEMDVPDCPVWHAANEIFENPAGFSNVSAVIAQHLFDVSVHPNIKKGELYVAYFHNMVLQDEIVDAIGIFKSENKDTYLKVYQHGDRFGINADSGVNIKRIDKACLIFNTEAEHGYRMSIIDNTNKGAEALYWKESFLNARPIENDFYNTKNFLTMCRDFSEHVLTEDNNVNNIDKMGFLNKSMDYFNDNKKFELENFEESVIRQPEVAEAFNEYLSEYEKLNNLPTEKNFGISPDAVKNIKKFFKSIIKLDKNFHVYVHGKPEYMEKGYDQAKEKKYYKLYYDNEI